MKFMYYSKENSVYLVYMNRTIYNAPCRRIFATSGEVANIDTFVAYNVHFALYYSCKLIIIFLVLGNKHSSRLQNQDFKIKTKRKILQ